MAVRRFFGSGRSARFQIGKAISGKPKTRKITPKTKLKPSPFKKEQAPQLKEKLSPRQEKPSPRSRGMDTPPKSRTKQGTPYADFDDMKERERKRTKPRTRDYRTAEPVPPRRFKALPKSSRERNKKLRDAIEALNKKRRER